MYIIYIVHINLLFGTVYAVGDLSARSANYISSKNCMMVV